MKRLVIFLAVLSLASSGFAGLLTQGTQELSLSGLIDFDSADGTLTSIEVGYGFFIIDSLEIGVEPAYENTDNATRWAVHLFGEYNFDMGTELVPFLGLSAGYAASKVSARVPGVQDVDEQAVIFSGLAGLKYFVTESIAVSGEFVYEWAAEDIYVAKDGMAHTDGRIQVGLRFFF